MPSATPKRTGRPSKWKPEFVELAQKLARLGLTDPQMAEVMGVALSTFSAWKGAHPEFMDALKKGKTISDANVADALYHRACGYSHPAVKIMVVAGRVIEVPYTEHYPPDTAAAFIWLKNRQRELWRDKPEEKGEDDTPPTPVNITVNVKDARRDAD